MQSGTELVRRVAESIGIGQRTTTAAGVTDRPRNKGTSQTENYVRSILQSLAVFRFASFAMGSGLAFLPNPGQDTALIPMFLVTGIYNMIRIAWRFDPENHKQWFQWANLSLDVGLSVTLILMSDGLDSPFLMYSLSPIVTASLLMDARSALTAATISALSISGVHIAGGLGTGGLPPVLSGNYLAFSLLYSAVCLLIAYLPFIANLNWQRRLRAESLTIERDRLRREVHDNVAQTLAFLSLKVRRAEERSPDAAGALTARDVADIGNAVERAYISVRDYLDGAEEGESHDLLEVRLGEVIDQWSKDTGISANFRVEGSEPELPPRVKHQLVQVVREALSNSAKHSNAQQVYLELICADGKTTLRVVDRGRGFSPSTPKGHGMDIMKERAAMADASLTINSTPGEGTEVIIDYPSNSGNRGN